MTNILNTRPSHQADNLTKLLEKHGVTVFHCPIFNMIPINFKPIKISSFDIIIFLSSNAVNFFFQKIKEKPTHQIIIAIGSATKKALNNSGCKNIFCPDYFNSEGVLKMPSLKNIHNKKVAIISGKNQKQLIQKELIKRGAIVDNIYCYMRKPISHKIENIFPTLRDQKIDIIISTSGDSFSRLINLFEQQKYRAWLLKKTICIISEDMKKKAIDVGFKSIIQAENATDKMIAKALLR